MQIFKLECLLIDKLMWGKKTNKYILPLFLKILTIKEKIRQHFTEPQDKFCPECSGDIDYLPLKRRYECQSCQLMEFK